MEVTFPISSYSRLDFLASVSSLSSHPLLITGIERKINVIEKQQQHKRGRKTFDTYRIEDDYILFYLHQVQESGNWHDIPNAVLQKFPWMALHLNIVRRRWSWLLIGPLSNNYSINPIRHHYRFSLSIFLFFFFFSLSSLVVGRVWWMNWAMLDWTLGTNWSDKHRGRNRPKTI